MSAQALGPGDPDYWTEMGREPGIAKALAQVWSDHPDPPNDAPLWVREAASKARQAVMKPLYDAIQAQGERERRARNFAFTEAKLAAGNDDEQSIAILRARDEYGYDWDEAVEYARGWYAAHAGWEKGGARRDNFDHVSTLAIKAYDQGFTDGGGQDDDIFGAARRKNLAALRRDNQDRPTPTPIVGRPVPSSWPKPTDTPRPTPWSKRMIIIEESVEQRQDRAMPAVEMFDGEHFRALRACPGYQTAAIAIISSQYGIIAGDEIVKPYEMDHKSSDVETLRRDAGQRARLAKIIDGRELDDTMIVASEAYLAVLDAHADAIPLCRSMERTRNSALQARTHLRTWLARGTVPGQTIAAGHIRWGGVYEGLKGSLGEVSARYAGPLPKRGHEIIVELADGQEAFGYFDTVGTPIPTRITVSGKSHVKGAITTALRTFAAAVRLGA